MEGPKDEHHWPTWTLYDPYKHQYYRISALDKALLEHWPTKNNLTPDELLLKVNQCNCLKATLADISEMLVFLGQHDLVNVSALEQLQKLRRANNAGKTTWWKWLLHHYLFIRIPLMHPDRFLSRMLPVVEPLYSRTAVRIFIALLVLALYLASREWDRFIHTLNWSFSAKGAALFGITLIFVKVIHELGHAFTAKHYGLRVPTMGLCFLVMWPVLYTDTTDAWRLKSRRQRIAIGLAGIIAETGLAITSTIIWAISPAGPVQSAAFFVATTSWFMTVAINGNPFMRWDGYYVFSDAIGVENLQHRAFELAKWQLRAWIPGIQSPPPEIFEPRKQRILLAYAYGTWLYRVGLFLGIALLVYHMFFKVLGVFLMMVEICWFLAIPVWREIMIWKELKIPLNGKLRLTGLGIGMLIIVAMPISQHVTAIALVKPSQRMEIYPPVASRVVKSFVHNGQRVAAGQILFELSSPQTRFEKNVTETRLLALDAQKRLAEVSDEKMDQLPVLESKISKEAQRYKHSLTIMRKLRVRAKTSGVIAKIPDGLSGRWVSPQTRLGVISNGRARNVVAWVEENDLERLAAPFQGQFYPNNADAPPRQLSILADLRATPVSHIAEPIIASVSGGEVAVRKNGNELVPEKSLFRITGTLDSGEKGYDKMYRGRVRLDAKSKSLLDTLWRPVMSLLIRESGI